MSRARSLLLLGAVVAVGGSLMSVVYGRDQGCGQRSSSSCSAAVRMLIEGMQAGFVDEASQRRAVDQFAFHVQSLDTLIEDLFELSRIEAGDVNRSVEPVR